MKMKTAVSISPDLFGKAERFAKRNKMSRSKLYSKAIEEYLEKDDKQKLIDRINKVCEEVDTSIDPFWKQMQSRALSTEEW